MVKRERGTGEVGTKCCVSEPWAESAAKENMWEGDAVFILAALKTWRKVWIMWSLLLYFQKKGENGRTEKKMRVDEEIDRMEVRLRERRKQG